jgi:hypothetical protein
MASRPDPILPDGEDESKSAPEHASKTLNRRTDLLALIVIVSVPLVLVLIGHAQAAIIVASGEFVVLALRAWRREG